MIKINKILKYLKKNIYLVCLILALSYIAYNKLYKNKESFENLLISNYEYSGINKHILADLKEKEIPIPDDSTRQSFILKHKILKYLKYDKLVEFASKNEITKKIYDDILQDWESNTKFQPEEEGGGGAEEEGGGGAEGPSWRHEFKSAFTMDKFPYWMQLFYYIEENQITEFLNNMNNNDKLLYYSERITSYEDIRQYIPPISAILFNEFCKVILTNLIKTSHTFNTMIEQARLDEEAKQAAAFGKKEDRVILKDINVTDFSIFDMASEPKKHFWVDLQSFKINGSKKLAIVDANQYDVVKNKLEDVIQPAKIVTNKKGIIGGPPEARFNAGAEIVG